MKVQQIPYEGKWGSGKGQYVPVQIGDDWPGLFIRGDSFSLLQFLKESFPSDAELSEAIDSCHGAK